jgi:glycosyltransferase involved in cell wall biosynthesis
VRIAIATPFLDRRHGTERVLLEQLERISSKPGVELHLYAQRVEDLGRVLPYETATQCKSSNTIVWHKIPAVPGPHLFGYIWWFLANQLYRWRDDAVRGLKYDLVYSPGINGWDADAIVVHAVFHQKQHSRLGLIGWRPWKWPRRVHRRLYYLLIMALERRIYPRPNTSLAAVSQLIAHQLDNFFARSDARVIPNAVDALHFTPEARATGRSEARQRFALTPETFVMLLIGNDWENKGLRTVLRSMAGCQDLPLKLLVVGRDDATPFLLLIRQLQLQGRIQFEPPSPDVLQFYAAADLYASPSLEDSFGLPTLESMACGLPVITSINAGVSQLITNSVDGFVLKDPSDAPGLASILRELYGHPDICRKVGERAARTASAYSWDRNARETWEFLMAALEKKRVAAGGPSRPSNLPPATR